MEMSNFTSPMQAVQMISMFSYLNTLNDFLLTQHFLNKTYQYQPIPIVNALYNYFFTENSDIKQNEIIDVKKKYLARKLIQDTDLYGGKENENLDDAFVDALYKHIITTLVFEKFTNINGFLVEIVRNSKDVKINPLMEQIISALAEETFLSENGMLSKLEKLAIFKILQDFIVPLFPKPKRDVSLVSIDYIYAQAGAIFDLSSRNPSLIKPTEYEHKDEIDKKFNQFIAIGHAVQQLASAEKINQISLRIFALPALFYYVYKEKQNLQNVTTGNIIKNSTHGTRALKILFSHLNDTFKKIEEIQKSSGYQFHSAMSNFKNRTTLARENIGRCSFDKKVDLEEEILKYKNNHNYECNSVRLENLNRVYQEQVNNISNKYFVYEKESIRKAFGSEFIKSIDGEKVTISRGFIKYSYDGLTVYETQLVKLSHDLLKFYFSGNESSVYYAILRVENKLTVIQENSPISSNSPFISNSLSPITSNSTSPIILCNSKSFREKLGLTTESFGDNNFPTVLKKENENFEGFINRIAEERVVNFNKSLSIQGYDQTRKEWWTDFGLSFLPFYNCYQGIVTKNLEETEIACPLDIIFIFPLVGEIGNLIGRMTTAVSESLLKGAEITLGSLALRMTMKKTLTKLTGVLVTQGTEFSHLLAKGNLGVTLFRYLDPGFELIYTIGKGGIKSIKNLITTLRRYPISLESLEKNLMESEEKIENSIRKVTDIVYINSLSKKDAGYGYKFIQLPDRIVQIRKVRQYEEEIPVVFEGSDCKAINIYTGKVKDKVLELRDQPNRKSVDFRVESFHDPRICGNLRIKRSPITSLCIRNTLRQKKLMVEKAAMDFVYENSELTEEIVRKELRRFVFPGEGEMQLKFVRDWRELIRNGESKLPDWSKKFEIYDPGLFDRLRYADYLDKEVIAESEAVIRLDAIHPPEGIGAPFSSLAGVLLKHFEEAKAFEYTTLEDYLAIRQYMGNGYKKIGETTLEAQRMREALYRLAIRQSEDPIEEFATTLFRGESRPAEVVEKLFYSGSGEIQLNRFTSTTLVKDIAFRFQYGARHNVLIVYEMKFSESYPRANLQRIAVSNSEKEIVLLPGSSFRIDSVTPITFYEKRMLNVKMTFMHDKYSKSEWFKNIMDELEKLEKHGPGVYEIDKVNYNANSNLFFDNIQSSKFNKHN